METQAALASRNTPLEQHQDGAEAPAKILAEVLLIAGEQVRGPGLEGSLEDRLIFLREAYPRRQGARPVMIRTRSRSLVSLCR